MNRVKKMLITVVTVLKRPWVIKLLTAQDGGL